MGDPERRADPDEVAGEVGRQNERTTLAWRRTNLAALGVAALAAKASGETVVALLLLIAAFGVSAVIGWRADHRALRRATAIDDWDAGGLVDVAAPGTILAATGLNLGLAAAGLLIVVAL